MFGAAALAAGLGAGRALLVTQLEARKQSTIDEAVEEARDQIRAHADEYISGSLREFVRRLVVKSILLGFLVLALVIAPADRSAELVVLGAVLAALMFWDAVSAWPTVRILAGRLVAAHLSPRRAVAEAVAAHVFAEVLRKGRELTMNRTQTLLLAAAGTSEGRFKTDVAEAVSTIAADASWQDLKPFILLAGAKALVLFALYALYVWSVLRALF